MGNKDRKYISAVPPCLPVTRPLCNGANTPSARNAGNASADTQGMLPFPSALGGPFAAPLFAPLSAAGTLCGCAAQFYFRFLGLDIVTLFNYSFVRLSRTFFRHRWKRLPTAHLHARIEKINWCLSFRYAPHQKPPLCKGRCQPNRLTEGLLQQAATNSHWFSAKTQHPLHNPPVRNRRFLTAPFTQGGLGCGAELRDKLQATSKNPV